jgi:hypothetical protein
MCFWLVNDTTHQCFGMLRLVAMSFFAGGVQVGVSGVVLDGCGYGRFFHGVGFGGGHCLGFGRGF